MPNPFQVSPGALTKLINASTSGGVLTQVCTGGEQGVLLTNNSSVGVCVALGTSSIVATVPTTLAAGTGLCLPANTSKVFWMPGGPGMGYVDAISTVGAVTVHLFATPGFGGL